MTECREIELISNTGPILALSGAGGNEYIEPTEHTEGHGNLLAFFRAFPCVPWAKKIMTDSACIHKSQHRIQYLYKLTPGGLEEKARVTSRFLKQKLREYEEIKAEIEELRQETGQ